MNTNVVLNFVIFIKGLLTIKHGLSIGVTNSSDLKSPFFRAEFDPNGHKHCEKNTLKNHNDLTKKIHQTYKFCDDSMNDEKMAAKQTF